MKFPSSKPYKPFQWIAHWEQQIEVERKDLADYDAMLSIGDSAAVRTLRAESEARLNRYERSLRLSRQAGARIDRSGCVNVPQLASGL